MDIQICVANKSHAVHANVICKMMYEAAQKRGTGIATRNPNYISEKISKGHAVIGLNGEVVVGFCYIESWDHATYVANSGLIINSNFQGLGLAKAIKKEAFELSKNLFPEAKLFGITTSRAVMKINTGLGYEPVTFSELPKDEKFWKGCSSCPNYDILMRTKKTMCLCTGMSCDLSQTNINKLHNEEESTISI